MLAYWAKNHDGSFLWALKGWKRFKESDSPHVFRCSFCRFDNCWRKNTRFANNTWLQGIRMLCKCLRREHVWLRGYSRLHAMQWTEVAELYPRGLSRLLARATGQQSKPGGYTRTNSTFLAAAGVQRPSGQGCKPWPLQGNEGHLAA